MVRERAWMRDPGPPYKGADTDWTDDPTPEWPELIRLAKHRLEDALRTSDFGDPGIFFSLIESMLRLASMEEKFGAEKT